MRQEAAQQVWPAFGEKTVEGPFIYFNGEGSARYMEYKGMKVMEQWSKSEHKPSIQKYSLFHSHKDFQKIVLEQPDFEYLIYAGPNTYHNAIGFNILRILEQFGVPFQEKILTQPERGLHLYLEDYIQSQNRSWNSI